jgi:hypothetical protein
METKTNNQSEVHFLNKPAYIAFVLLGIYFLITKNQSESFIFFGLALVFDPFDVNVPFPKRPLYQRVLLIAHLAVTFILIGLELFAK